MLSSTEVWVSLLSTDKVLRELSNIRVLMSQISGLEPINIYISIVPAIATLYFILITVSLNIIRLLLVY